MDKILKFDRSFNPLVDNYRVEIVPRKYSYILTITIREPFSNEVQTLSTTANVYHSLLNIDLTGFIPVPDTKYELTITNQSGELIWLGGVLYTTKNIQNYQLNNSDENNLKF